MNTKFIL